MKKYDYIIVGSGLFGAVFAYKAKCANKRVLILEKRNHLGGNIYNENIEGINVHTYGAHIFHTNNKKIWDFVNLFVPFNQYINSPIANYKGKLYNLPFNMNTFYSIWGITSPSDAQKIIQEQRYKDNIIEPKNLEEQAIALVGKDLYNILIKGYTEKQWGRKCTELPAFIINRIPVRFTFDNNYFNDIYQGIPIGGYNKLIEGLFNTLEVIQDTNFFDNQEYWESITNKIIFTGKIDEYYKYCFGKLEYRAVRFENEILDCNNYQGNAVINYTDIEVPYTRIIEHKHFEFGNQSKTVITKEYAIEWKDGTEPFYPINDEKNNNLYERYRQLAKKEKNILFGGRLGEYKYYDMDKVIERALFIWQNHE
jgi:UDP-galactopyranose mutase